MRHKIKIVTKRKIIIKYKKLNLNCNLLFMIYCQVVLLFRLQNQRIVKNILSMSCIQKKSLKGKLFVLSVKVLSPYNNKWVDASSFMDRRFGLTISTFDCLIFWKLEQWRRLCLVNSVSLLQLQIRFRESQKL